MGNNSEFGYVTLNHKIARPKEPDVLAKRTKKVRLGFQMTKHGQTPVDIRSTERLDIAGN